MLQGHLHLTCAADAAGRSYVRRQSFRAPMHLSKPHADAGLLVVNAVNPTAGLFGGDKIDMRVDVESGARMLLTAPSASRAHRTHSGCASVEQEFHVASGGWLEVWPEIFIPQAGARYWQRTSGCAEPGGEMLLIEMMAPGRTAAGEVFAFEELDWDTELRLGAELVARERFTLRPSSPALAAMRAVFPEAYYASGFLISERLENSHPCWRRIHDLHDATAWVGCGALRGGGAAFRVVAAGSVPLRKKIAAIRREIYSALGMQEPSLRRT